MNRGRIQAQGMGLEKSESWAQNSVPTKEDGINMETHLKDQLTAKELRDRQSCFQRLERLIRSAPTNGYNENIKPSYTPHPPIRDVRVDAEIIKGHAFKD